MRKLLSIMAAIGLTATATTSVVACGTKNDNQNASASFSDVEGWINSTKAKNKDVNEEGKAMVIAIGGRYNSDTLSYLGAMNKVMGLETTGKPSKIIKNDAVDRMNNKLTSVTPTNSSNNDWEKDMTANLLNSLGIIREDSTTELKSEINTEYIGVDINKTNAERNVEFKTILVDHLATFWSSNLGKSLIKDIFKNQIEEFVNWKYDKQNSIGNNDIAGLENEAIKNKSIIDMKNLMKKTLNESKGPWFLSIRGGKLVGITNGFTSFYDYDPSSTDKDGSSLNDDNAKKALEKLFKALGDSFQNEVQWLDTSYSPNGMASGSDFIKTGEWDNSVAGLDNITDYDKIHENKTDDNDDSSESTDDKKLDYSEVDLKKYNN